MLGISIEYVADDGPADTGVADDEQMSPRISGDLSIVSASDARLQRLETFAIRWPVGDRIAAERPEGGRLLIGELAWASSLPSPHRNLAQLRINRERESVSRRDLAGELSRPRHRRAEDLVPWPIVADGRTHLLPAERTQRMIHPLPANHGAATRLAMANQIDSGILVGHKDLLGDSAAACRSSALPD